MTRKAVKKYHLMLFSDIILTTTESAAGSNNYKLHQWIELQHSATSVTDITPEQIAAQAQMLSSHGVNPTNAFFLNSSAKSFEVVCEGDALEAAQEKQEWLDLINEAIAERRGDAESDEEWAAEVAAAVWTPNADSCHVCDRQFSYKLRRHHCRACGCNVCKTCSAYKRERTITGSSSNFMGKATETKVLSERICSVCAGVETPKKSAPGVEADTAEPDPELEPESEPEPDPKPEAVVAKYKCVKKSQIRADFEMKSSKVGSLDAGIVIEVYELRTNDATGVSRVRFDRGWVSVQTGAGVVVLQKLDEQEADDKAEMMKEQPSDATSHKPVSGSVVPLDLTAGEPAIDGISPKPAARPGHTRRQLTLTRGSSGLGLEIDDCAVIARYNVEGGPGEAAGVKPGWRIVAINGVHIDNKHAVVQAMATSPGGALLFDFDVPDKPTAPPRPPRRVVPATLGAVPDRAAPVPVPTASAPLPAGLESAVVRTPVAATTSVVEDDEDLDDDDSSSGSEEEDLDAVAASGLTPTPRGNVPADLGLTRLPPEIASGEAGWYTLEELQGGIPEGVDPTRKEVRIQAPSISTLKTKPVQVEAVCSVTDQQWLWTIIICFDGMRVA